MWFVFPQMAGLGRSTTAIRFAIGSRREAQAYLDHPVLGPRLVEAASAVLAHTGRRAEDIFGGLDATKLRSSMTLFAAAAPGHPVFQQVLDQFFGGEADEVSLRLLTGSADQAPPDGPSNAP